jgi:hypothetical protein
MQDMLTFTPRTNPHTPFSTSISFVDRVTNNNTLGFLLATNCLHIPQVLLPDGSIAFYSSHSERVAMVGTRILAFLQHTLYIPMVDWLVGLEA